MAQTRKQRILGGVQKQRRRRAFIATGVVAIVMVGVIVGLILLQNSSPSSLLGTPIPQSLYGDFSGVSASTLTASINAPGVNPLTTIPGSPLISNGKVEFLYIGADYCPFCAAERWSIIVALSKFGTFSGLTYMQSSSSDSYPNTATFSFAHSSYKSNYNITFVSVETQDRNHNPLQTLSAAELNLLNQYDPGQGIPFLDVGGVYAIKPAASSPNVYSGSQFSPGILSGLNWTQIGSQLDNPSSSIALSVDGAADTIISAVCKVDGGAPGSLCSQSFASIALSPPATNRTLGYEVDLFQSVYKIEALTTWRISPRPT